MPARLPPLAHRLKLQMRCPRLTLETMATSGTFLSPAALVRADSSSMLSSSPDLPPLSDLMQRGPMKSALRSGSHAVVMSANTVGNLPAAIAKDYPTLNVVDKANRGNASVPKHVDSGPPPAMKAIRPRQSRVPAQRKNATASADDIRVPTKLSDGKATLQTRKVTKATIQKNAKAETKSKFFAAKSGRVNEPIEMDELFEAEPALKRRTNWTPPVESRPKQVHVTVTLETSSPSVRAVETDVFKKLQDSYKCSLQGEQGRAVSGGSGPPLDVLGKRKLIQLVATSKAMGSKAQHTSPTKTKAPKMKPRTITELAVAAYRVPEPTTDASAEASPAPLRYFDVDDPAGGEKVQEKAPRVRAKNMASKSTRVSKKKAEPKNQVLLSPTSALRRVSRQDFIYGTSSQLATEQDSDFLRAVQQAMLLSNRSDDPFGNSPFDDNPSDDDPPAAPALRAPKATGKLWGAGARDEHGDLHHVDVIDLLETAEAPSDYEKLAKASAQKGKGSPPRSTSTTRAMIHGLADSEPPASNQEHNRLLSQWQSQPQPQLQPTGSSQKRPEYEVWTDARLAKEVDSNGFKAVKRRTAMIALLNECWEAKNSAAVGMRNISTSPEKKALTVTTLAPKKARGRPRMQSHSADPEKKSDVSASPSPKRRRGRPRNVTGPWSRSPTEPAAEPESHVTSMDEEDAKKLSLLAPARPSAEQATLFSLITRAVTTAAPSADPENPSWHEKILMYDPVVLEDLAAWLNAGQLDRVGWDREVGPDEVKTWCEARSVCCMWRVNVHGKERKRV